ncbi:hypothetical protein LNP18_08630 [Leuconostoc citreum]|uniref:phage tail tube assembly chaperone n=1 Tax=Leuconostoc citreum TaxID=33964 RepID=UPI00200B12FC|nr:phage tail tube assembly chaperone [Leuconostoc citreum]MCK8606167.1 hypothetical protein [Leuconostoc citreum]
MTVKIIAKELGIKKAIEVRESNKNIRATWELQKMLAKLSIDQSQADEANPEEFEGLIDNMLGVQQKVINYVVDILKLTDSQAEKVDEMEFNETMNFAVRISSELLHIEAAEATEEDAGLAV